MTLPTLQKNLYSNWIMNGPDGLFMSRLDTKRAQWYLRRNLATLTGDSTIQLTFVPSGPGHADDLYYRSSKENRCVVCGKEENLTRHHVVPHTYRRFFPEAFKSRSSHDIVIICDEHHTDYENNHAILLTQKIAKEMGFPLHMGNHKNVVTKEEKAKRLARIWLGREMPLHRKEEIRWNIEYLIGHPMTEEAIGLLANATLKSHKGGPPKGSKTHWSEVVRILNETNAIPEFVRRWRQDFIDNAKPAFLPLGWSVEHEGVCRASNNEV